jgi:hypothetical protein
LVFQPQFSQLFLQQQQLFPPLLFRQLPHHLLLQLCLEQQLLCLLFHQLFSQLLGQLCRMRRQVLQQLFFLVPLFPSLAALASLRRRLMELLVRSTAPGTRHEASP